MPVDLEQFGEAWDPYLPKRRFADIDPAVLRRGLDKLRGGSHDYEKNDFGKMFDEACHRMIGTPLHGLEYHERPIVFDDDEGGFR